MYVGTYNVYISILTYLFQFKHNLTIAMYFGLDQNDAHSFHDFSWFFKFIFC